MIGDDHAMRYFFFGSLRDPDVLAIVLGRRLPPARFRPARLKGYRLLRVRGESYPLLTAAPAQVVHGALVYGLTAADAARLAFFEGEEYETTPIMVDMGRRHRLRSLAFRARPGLASDRRPWKFSAWRRKDKRAFLPLVHSWMELCRHANFARAEALWQERRRHGLAAALRRSPDPRP